MPISLPFRKYSLLGMSSFAVFFRRCSVVDDGLDEVATLVLAAAFVVGGTSFDCVRGRFREGSVDLGAIFTHYVIRLDDIIF